MEEKKLPRKNKGGRPEKGRKRSQLLGVRCDMLERVQIESAAKKCSRTVSEYLRELGLNPAKVLCPKALPKEILQLIGAFNHTAANLNQITRRHNQGDAITVENYKTIDELDLLCRQLASELRNHYTK